MSEFEKSGVKGKNVIQYASDKINELDDNNQIVAIKEIATLDKIVTEAIKTYKEEQDRIVDNNKDRTPTVTGPEIKKALEEGLYR